MKSSLRIKVIIFLLISSTHFNGFSQGYLKANAKKNENDKGEVILRGIGLGGWMLQEPYMLKLSGIVNNQSQFKAKVKDLIGDEQTNTFYKALDNSYSLPNTESFNNWQTVNIQNINLKQGL